MPPFESEVFIGSKEKAENGYGQNGYQGPSSDLPGERTTSGFLPQSSVPASGWQTRSVSAEQLPAAHGMKGPKTGEKIAAHNSHRPSVQKAPGSFQR